MLISGNIKICDPAKQGLYLFDKSHNSLYIIDSVQKVGHSYW